jgi:hypothetical protein
MRRLSHAHLSASLLMGQEYGELNVADGSGTS